MTTQVPAANPGANPQPPFNGSGWTNRGWGLWLSSLASGVAGCKFLLAGTRDRPLPVGCNPPQGLDFNRTNGEYYTRDGVTYESYGFPDSFNPIASGADGPLVSSNYGGIITLDAGCAYDRVYQLTIESSIALVSATNISVNIELILDGNTVNPPQGYSDVQIQTIAPIAYSYTCSPARPFPIVVPAGTTRTIDARIRNGVGYTAPNTPGTPGDPIALSLITLHLWAWDA